MENDAAERRVIKRYANRKLYDTTASRYVTLEDLAERIREGEDLQVIDNRTKEDLTSVTLAQIIFEQQKSRRRPMSLTALRTLIQGKGELFQRLSQPVKELKEEAAKQVEKLRRPAEVIEERRQAMMEALENMQRSIEDTQTRIDDRVREAVESVSLVWHLKREIDELKIRIQSLEGRCKCSLEAEEADEAEE